jgi:hypothetical protein
MWIFGPSHVIWSLHVRAAAADQIICDGTSGRRMEPKQLPAMEPKEVLANRQGFGERIGSPNGFQ